MTHGGPAANDDPFAPGAIDDPGPTIVPLHRTPTPAPFADRDPDAAPEQTAEHATTTGIESFDDVLRRARRRGFVQGCAAGGAAVAALAAAAWVLAGSTGVPTRVARGERVRPGEARAAVREVPGPGAQTAPAPAARSRGGAVRAAPPVARRASAAEVEVAGEAGSEADVEGERPVAAPAPAEAQADAGLAERRPPGAREVMAALRERADAIDECVALTPGHEGNARGRRFALLVVIEPGGGVSEAKVQAPDLESTPVGVCLAGLARDLSFPPFEGEAVRVELPVRYGRSE